jgi:hypothetical protein
MNPRIVSQPMETNALMVHQPTSRDVKNDQMSVVSEQKVNTRPLSLIKYPLFLLWVLGDALKSLESIEDGFGEKWPAGSGLRDQIPLHIQVIIKISTKKNKDLANNFETTDLHQA